MKRIDADSPLLRVLKGTIASLPAYQHAAADAPPAFTEVGLRYTRYSEDSLDRQKVILGSTDRYDIDVTQLWIEAPVGANWSVALDVQNDYQTGASSWFVGETVDGSPGIVMSGASIDENRVEVGIATRYFWADGNAGLSVTHSDENDYEALALGLDLSWNNADNSRTWSASFSSSSDTVEPTRGRIPVFIDSEELETQSVYFGVSQILSRTAIVRVGLNYTYSEGYLSDPYKFRDSRPDEHQRVALSVGYRRFFITANGALRLDYRYYDDDWGTDSHALEAGWTQNFDTFSVTPYLRYYSQREADFWSVVADRSRTYRADDFRLSSFGAVTAGVRGVFDIGDWRFEAQAERYMSDNGWGLFDGDAAPALVDFWRGTLGVSWRFD